MKLFKKYKQPNKNKWPSIALTISKNFEYIRDEWFQTWLENLEEAQEFNVKNREINPPLTYSLKGFQMYISSMCVGNLKYIKPKYGKEFINLLAAQVCGTELNNCQKYYSKYLNCESENSIQKFEFYLDIASYITGKESPVIEATILSGNHQRFQDMNFLAIVAAFGDEKTYNEIKDAYGIDNTD